MPRCELVTPVVGGHQGCIGAAGHEPPCRVMASPEPAEIRAWLGPRFGQSVTLSGVPQIARAVGPAGFSNIAGAWPTYGAVYGGITGPATAWQFQSWCYPAPRVETRSFIPAGWVTFAGTLPPGVDYIATAGTNPERFSGYREPI